MKKLLIMILVLCIACCTGCTGGKKEVMSVKDKYVNDFIEAMRGNVSDDCPEDIKRLVNSFKENDDIEIQLNNTKLVSEMIAEDPFTYVDEVDYTTPEYDDKVYMKDGYAYIKLGDLHFDNKSNAFVVVDNYLTTINSSIYSVSYSFVKSSESFDFSVESEVEKAKNVYEITLKSKDNRTCVVEFSMLSEDNIRFAPHDWGDYVTAARYK